MKKIGFILGIIILIIPFKGFGSENNSAILKFKNDSDVETYSSSDSIQDVIYNTFHDLMVYSSEISLNTEYSDNLYSDKLLKTIMNEGNTEFVIYGSYHYVGDAIDPSAVIEIEVYNVVKKMTELEKSYSANVGIDFLDEVEGMVQDVVSVILEKAVTYASLRFSGIEVMDSSYDIYVNDQFVDTVADNDYQNTLKVLADGSYTVKLIRSVDRVTVYEEEFSPTEDERITISYDATYELELAELRKTAEKSKKAYLDLNYIKLSTNQYTITVNGTAYVISNESSLPERIEVEPNRQIRFEIMNGITKNKIFTKNYVLKPGQITSVKYESTGTLVISVISNRDPEGDYVFLLNDEPLKISYQGRFTMPVSNYIFQLQKDEKIIYTTNFYLNESTVTVKPRDKKYREKKTYDYDEYLFVFRNETIFSYNGAFIDLFDDDTNTTGLPGIAFDLELLFPRWYLGAEIFLFGLDNDSNLSSQINPYAGLYFFGYKMKTEFTWIVPEMIQLKTGYTLLGNYTKNFYWDVSLKAKYNFNESQIRMPFYTSFYANLNLFDIYEVIKYDLFTKAEIRIMNFLKPAEIANDFRFDLTVGIRLDIGK